MVLPLSGGEKKPNCDSAVSHEDSFNKPNEQVGQTTMVIDASAQNDGQYGMSASTYACRLFNSRANLAPWRA